jgi:hypothetical protein
MKPGRTKLARTDDCSSFRCECGEPGFVDIGEGKKNRYPCRKCYRKLRKKDFLERNEP